MLSRGAQFARRIRAGRRVLVSVACGLVLFPLLPSHLAVEARVALAWDAAAATYLGLILVLAFRSHPEHMKRRASEEDITVATNLLIAVAAAGFSLFAVTSLLVIANTLPQPTRSFHLVLGGATTFLSWLVVHTLFAVHTAHSYYAPDATRADGLRRGLLFPSEDAPDYFDFLYYAFVIGMAAQVSDIDITSRELRRTALVHGIVAFVFNTIVLAFVVNIAAGLL